MVKVLRHGNKIRVKNPITGELTVLIDVVFVEEGRSGANKSLAATNDVFNTYFGKSVGLDQLRTHTQAFKEGEIGNFPIHKDFNGEGTKTFPFFINRTMYSTPQMRQQVGVAPRMIDGKPTYFTTAIEAMPMEDVDKRDPVEITAKLRPQLWDSAVVGTAEVEILELVQPGPATQTGTPAVGQGAQQGAQQAATANVHEPLPS